MGWRKRKAQQQKKGPAVKAKPVEVKDIPQLDPIEEPTTMHEQQHTPTTSTVEPGTSTIGAFLRITGELSGDENVVVHGQVDGTISLVGTDLTVGQSGRVNAEVHANSVVVEGEVVGDITAEGRVEVAATGSIQGDIRAGRVVLAEGARFRGRIDMGPPDDDRSFFQESTETTEEEQDEAPQSSFLESAPEVSTFD